MVLGARNEGEGRWGKREAESTGSGSGDKVTPPTPVDWGTAVDSLLFPFTAQTTQEPRGARQKEGPYQHKQRHFFWKIFLG